MNKNQKTIENAFYSDGYKLGMNVAVSDNDQSVLYESVSEMYDMIDNFNEYISKFANQQNKQIDCKKGCEWCCHQPVFALDYELDYLIDYIKSNFDNKLKKDIKTKAENKNNKLSMLNETSLLNAKFPCPLLQDGACIAYQARPMACRIYLSQDVKSCFQFFNNPGKDTSIPALLNLPLRTGQMMNEGFKAALKTNGIKTREFRIEEKLLEL